MTSIIYNTTIPQIMFAADEIKASLNRHSVDVAIQSLADYPHESQENGTVIILSLHTDTELLSLFPQYESPDFAPADDKQSYCLRTSRKGGNKIFWVIGSDVPGIMYGSLRLAEILSFNYETDTIVEDATPHIKKRGIKFNIVLDQRMPGFNYKGDSEKSNVAHMWDISFWKEYLDELARNRYNVLSFWTKHPFTAMIKLPDYPDTEVHDVIDGYGNLVKKMSIDDKISFWKKVMEYADDRSIDIYYFTWNIYLNNANGKYGISEEPKNETTKTYLRECIREFLITYPQVKGLGVTAGENMPGISFDEREQWLWDTYGKGISDVKQQFPQREISFIHRHWYSSVSDIMSHFEEYDGPFEFSFKYAKAHLHSNPVIPFADALLKELPEGTNCWWNLRNDDIFYLRWGDPEYVRDFIRHFDSHKTAGYLMGSDGYVWGRTCNSKDPAGNGMLENKKHWYEFLLWGRLGYDPDLPDSFFKEHLKLRFPESKYDLLYSAWQASSKIIPQVVRFFWRDWDFEWYPEGCKGGKFITVNDFMTGKTMEGAGILNIAEYCQLKLENLPFTGLTPPEIAEKLEGHASESLRLLESCRAQSIGAANGHTENRDLIQTLDDIEAFAWLGRYYAKKIRGATALAMYSITSENNDRDEAVKHLEAALDHWRLYTKLLDRHYIPRNLDRTGMMDWHDLTQKVVDEIEIARKFQPFKIDISIGGADDGGKYPVSSDFTINVKVDSTYNLDHVMFKWNGENLGNLYKVPYIWQPVDYAPLKSVSTGSYEIGIVAFDLLGNSAEKTIRITVV